ncbi:MAG: hypothetical protein R3E87_26495 [Burkholderiaceae bacterium]
MARSEPLAPARGQALVETLLGATLLALVAFAVVMLGRLFGIDNAAAGAARMSAFHCALRPEGCESALPKVAAVHFDGAPGSTGDPQFWHDRLMRPLLDADAPFKVGSSIGAFSAARGLLGAGRLGAAAARMIDDLAGPARFGLDAFSGLRTQSVAVPLWRQAGATARPDLLTGFRLEMNARSAILVDAWQARGPTGTEPDTVAARVARGAEPPLWHARVPAIAHAGTHAFMRLSYLIGLDADPDPLIDFELDVDLVPQDREPQ